MAAIGIAAVISEERRNNKREMLLEADKQCCVAMSIPNFSLLFF